MKKHSNHHNFNLQKLPRKQRLPTGVHYFEHHWLGRLLAKHHIFVVPHRLFTIRGAATESVVTSDDYCGEHCCFWLCDARYLPREFVVDEH